LRGSCSKKCVRPNIFTDAFGNAVGESLAQQFRTNQSSAPTARQFAQSRSAELTEAPLDLSKPFALEPIPFLAPNSAGEQAFNENFGQGQGGNGGLITPSPAEQVQQQADPLAPGNNQEESGLYPGEFLFRPNGYKIRTSIPVAPFLPESLRDSAYARNTTLSFYSRTEGGFIQSGDTTYVPPIPYRLPGLEEIQRQQYGPVTLSSVASNFGGGLLDLAEGLTVGTVKNGIDLVGATFSAGYNSYGGLINAALGADVVRPYYYDLIGPVGQASAAGASQGKILFDTVFGLPDAAITSVFNQDYNGFARVSGSLAGAAGLGAAGARFGNVPLSTLANDSFIAFGELTKPTNRFTAQRGSASLDLISGKSFYDAIFSESAGISSEIVGPFSLLSAKPKIIGPYTPLSARSEVLELQKIIRNGRVNADELLNYVPGNTVDSFIPSATIADGFKFKFERNETKLEVKLHSPDLNAASKFPGGNSATGYTTQIKVGNKLIGTDGFLYSQPSNITHIPLDF
jgi:hypothetical protein